MPLPHDRRPDLSHLPHVAALARAVAGQPLLGGGELEQILIRLDQIGDLLRAIEQNTRPTPADMFKPTVTFEYAPSTQTGA